MKTYFNAKKVPVIPPLLFNGAFVTNFQVKPNIFNSFFAKQCTLVSNNNVLPSELTYMTEGRIQSITFSESDVIKIIRAFDVNKAHGHDNISVKMIKLSTNSVAHPLTLIFQNYLNINRVFAVIHVFINYLQSLMTSFQVLTAVLL